MTQRIMELARAMGNVSAEEEELLTTLCGAARQELTGTLRDGVEPEDCPEIFALAGAWLVLAGLEVGRSAGRMESFTAGDVTIREGNAADRVKMLRAQAKQLMSGWTRNDAFLFYGVNGL